VGLCPLVCGVKAAARCAAPQFADGRQPVAECQERGMASLQSDGHAERTQSARVDAHCVAGWVGGGRGLREGL